MVLLDSNIFIIDRFFPRDSLYSQNKAFVERLASTDAAISSFTFLELCGVASFRLSANELSAWLFGFSAIYPVSVIDLHGLRSNDGEAWWSTFLEEVANNIAKKMTFGDAALLREAERYNVEAVITWNKKDFARRTRLAIATPTEYLQSR
jgi:hypothetical protein